MRTERARSSGPTEVRGPDRRRIAAEALKRIEAGESFPEVAAELGVSPPRLAAWMRAARGDLPKQADVSPTSIGDTSEAGIRTPGALRRPDPVIAPEGITVHDVLTAHVRVRRQGGRQVVDFGDGNFAPYSGHFTATDGVPFPVEIHYRWSEPDRRFIIRKVTCQSESGITGEALRAIPLDRLLTTHLAVSASHRATRAEQTAGRDQGHIEVALLYTAAYTRHQPPVVAVAEALGISRSAANKRVIAARKAGYLPPTSRGKAGA